MLLGKHEVPHDSLDRYSTIQMADPVSKTLGDLPDVSASWDAAPCRLMVAMGCKADVGTQPVGRLASVTAFFRP